MVAELRAGQYLVEVLSWTSGVSKIGRGRYTVIEVFVPVSNSRMIVLFTEETSNYEQRFASWCQTGWHVATVKTCNMKSREQDIGIVSLEFLGNRCVSTEHAELESIPTRH